MRSCQQIKNGIHGHQNWVVMLKTIFPAENYKYIIFVVIRAPNQSKSTNFLFTDSQKINFAVPCIHLWLGMLIMITNTAGDWFQLQSQGAETSTIQTYPITTNMPKFEFWSASRSSRPSFFDSSFLWYFFAIQISYSGGGGLFLAQCILLLHIQISFNTIK